MPFEHGVTFDKIKKTIVFSNLNEAKQKIGIYVFLKKYPLSFWETNKIKIN